MPLVHCIEPCQQCDFSDIGCADEEEQTFCAPSLSAADVQGAINAALSHGGDTTVFLPDGTETWNANDSINVDTGSSPKKLRLIGSGRDKTIIDNFQFEVPNDRRTNFVELGHLTMDGTDSVHLMVNARNAAQQMAPETDWTELYWHDFTFRNYAPGSSYSIAPLVMWHGVVSDVDWHCENVENTKSQDPYGITIYGDGIYSDHTPDFGTRKAFFIEDSRFYNCSHSISEFCDGFTVIRYNTFYSGFGSQLDSHGPGYNYCPYRVGAGEEHHAGAGWEAYGNLFLNATYAISPRAGSGGLVYNNTCGDGTLHCVRPRIEASSCAVGSGCGDQAGETYQRCHSESCSGCRQAPEKWWIWDNRCIGTGCSSSSFSIEYYCDPGTLQENRDYFLRAPSVVDGLNYVPFRYPHPLAYSGCTADASGNGVVEVIELRAYIDGWLSGSVLLPDLISAINGWKNGCR